MARMLVYVAGPYSAPDSHWVQRNVDAAIAAGHQIIEKGHHPYIPHLTHYVCIHYACKWEGSDRRWVALDEPWVEKCDAIYIMPSSYTVVNGANGAEIKWLSKGAQFEYEKARKIGKKIFWNVRDIPEAEDGPFLGHGEAPNLTGKAQ